MRIKTILIFLCSVCFAGLALGSGTVSTPGASYNYEVKAQIFIDGNLVAEPRIDTMSGDKTELIQTARDQTKKMRFSVVATEKEHHNIKDAISLKIELDYKDGKRMVSSKPEILVPPGKEGKIKQQRGGAQGELVISVIANRK
jgi:hypothetical protein